MKNLGAGLISFMVAVGAVVVGYLIIEFAIRPLVGMVRAKIG